MAKKSEVDKLKKEIHTISEQRDDSLEKISTLKEQIEEKESIIKEDQANYQKKIDEERKIFAGYMVKAEAKINKYGDNFWKVWFSDNITAQLMIPVIFIAVFFFVLVFYPHILIEILKTITQLLITYNNKG